MKKQKGKNQKWEFTRKDYRKYQLSEPAGTAVYASPAGTFSENTEKEMHCSPEKKSELSVP